MNRNEIYDHLAQVYLGKRQKALQVKKAQKKHFSVWLVMNVMITVVVFGSAFYGLSAFWQKNDLQSNIIYSLHHGAIRIGYDFQKSLSPRQVFELDLPQMDASRYGSLDFLIRAKEEGNPGIVKVVLTNQRNEESCYYVQNVTFGWKKVSIPVEEFKHISDWSSLKTVSVVLESWNVEQQKGLILIDDLRFSGTHLANNS